MLNYISAELYKLRYKKSLFIGIVALLALESLLFVPALWIADQPLKDELLSFLDALLPMGFFLSPVFAVLVFDNQHGCATLKNEVVFGIPRSRIYLGKLLSAMLVGTVAAVLVVGWYLLLCTLSVGPLMEARFWEQFLSNILSAWHTWLAALAFAMLLLFSLRSSVAAMVIAYQVAFFCVPMGIVGVDPDPGHGPALWVKVLVNICYSAPFRRFWYSFGEIYTPNFQPPLDWSPLWHALLVCALWVGVTTALGLFFFRRREVK